MQVSFGDKKLLLLEV